MLYLYLYDIYLAGWIIFFSGATIFGLAFIPATIWARRTAPERVLRVIYEHPELWDEINKHRPLVQVVSDGLDEMGTTDKMKKIIETNEMKRNKKISSKTDNEKNKDQNKDKDKDSVSDNGKELNINEDQVAQSQ